MGTVRAKNFGEMGGREHSDTTPILLWSFCFWEMRSWKMMMCIFFLVVLLSAEATSAAPLQAEASALGESGVSFKSSNLALVSSSVVKRAALQDTNHTLEVKTKAVNASLPNETATQKSTSAQAIEQEKQDAAAAPEEESPKEDVKEAVESKTEQAKVPVDETAEDEVDSALEEAHMPMAGLKGLSYDAILRGFYVFVGIGTIVLLYIVIKLIRLRRRRATRKYRVLAQHSDDQEMFPLAADDGEDEEIYNAADHHTVK